MLRPVVRGKMPELVFGSAAMFESLIHLDVPPVVATSSFALVDQLSEWMPAFSTKTLACLVCGSSKCAAIASTVLFILSPCRIFSRHTSDMFASSRGDVCRLLPGSFARKYFLTRRRYHHRPAALKFHCPPKKKKKPSTRGKKIFYFLKALQAFPRSILEILSLLWRG